jgi:hypothetical protein
MSKPILMCWTSYLMKKTKLSFSVVELFPVSKIQMSKTFFFFKRGRGFENFFEISE